MSLTATFVPFEGEELEASQYVFEHIPPVESVYADALLSGMNEPSYFTNDEINYTPQIQKNEVQKVSYTNEQSVLLQAHFLDLTPYNKAKPEKIYYLSRPWKGWSGIAKIIPKNKSYSVTCVTFKNKEEKSKTTLENKLNFIPYQPRQVAYFY
uniref:Conserved domain protein n=1 Tax=Parastrongyloides trichosuri TaxID=131310 RepID=A0A0N4ZZ41_PARTI